jgi:hypothetical protein
MAEEEPKKRGRGRPPKVKTAAASEESEPGRPAQTQMEGEGFETVTIPEIDKAADKYIKIKDARCKISPKEIAAKGELIDAIHAHQAQLPKDGEGSTVYRYDDLVIKLIPGKEKLEIKEQGDEE